MIALMPLRMAAPSSSAWGQERVIGPLGGVERGFVLPDTTLAPPFSSRPNPPHHSSVCASLSLLTEAHPPLSTEEA